MEIGNKVEKFNLKFNIVFAILMGLLFSGMWFLTDYWLDGTVQSLNRYLFQGIFFGVFMGILFPYMTEKLVPPMAAFMCKNIKLELTEHEDMEIEGPAWLSGGVSMVGGKLFLTNKKVIFKSHKFNFQKRQVEIYYQRITELIKRKTRPWLNNVIRVKTNDGQEFDLVVNEREKWIEKLNEKIQYIK